MTDPTAAAAKLLPFAHYRRKQIAELRAYVPGEPLDGVSISEKDRLAGSPLCGDMIARNPDNHTDQWLVAAKYFADNFEIENTRLQLVLPAVEPDFKVIAKDILSKLHLRIQSAMGKGPIKEYPPSDGAVTLVEGKLCEAYHLGQASQPAPPEGEPNFAARLFEFIKHGDEEHQAWLREAIVAFLAGAPRPATRLGHAARQKQKEPTSS